MKIEPMAPDHVTMIDVQDMQPEMDGIASREYASYLIKLGPALVGVDNGRIIMCGGCAELWPGRYLLWALLSRKSGPHMFSIVKATKRFLDLQTGRVEAVVRTDFTEAHRLAIMCGLRWHHHEEKFLPGGVDADVYVRFY